MYQDSIITNINADTTNYLQETGRITDQNKLNEIFEKLIVPRNFRKLHLYKTALSCVLANLIYFSNRNQTVSFGRYSKYNHEWYTYTIIKNVFDVLCEDESCFMIKGKYKLHKMSSNKYFSPRFNQLHIKREKPKNFIIIKKQNNHFLPVKISRRTTKMINDINRFNKVLENCTVRFRFACTNELHMYKPKFEMSIENYLNAGHIKAVSCINSDVNNKIWFIDYIGTPYSMFNEYEFEICPESLYLTRNFARGKLNCGGRFYSPVYQNLKQDIRKTITINGEDTVELDYSGHHIRMLYHKEGLNFEDEPYVYNKSDVKNSNNRLIYKTIAMVAINARTREKAIFGTRNKLREDKESKKYNGRIPSIAELENYYDEFKRYHNKIAKYIGADAGIWLQKLDSDIINKVLIELSKDNIIALPVHDSLITQTKHKDILENVMLNKYEETLNFKPIIE